MSLISSSSAPMAMSAGVAAWNNPNASRSSQNTEDFTFGPRSSSIEAFSEGKESNMYRGRYSGDCCFSIDCNDNAINCAAWLEEKAELISIKSKSAQNQAIISITVEGNGSLFDFLDVKKKLERNIPSGLLVGSISEISKQIPDVGAMDSIKPFHLLGCTLTDGIAAQEMIDLKYDEATKATNVALTKSSKNSKDPLLVLPEELCSILVAYWAKQTSDLVNQLMPESSDKKKKKTKVTRNRVSGVTFVVPSASSHVLRAALVRVAKETGIACDGIVSRGLASVVGAITNPLPFAGKQAKSLLPVLIDHLTRQKKNGNSSGHAIVLVVIRSSSGAWDVSLVDCKIKQAIKGTLSLSKSSSSLKNSTEALNGDLASPPAAEGGETICSPCSFEAPTLDKNSQVNPFDLVTALAVAGTPSPSLHTHWAAQEAEAELVLLLDRVLKTASVAKTAISAILQSCTYNNSTVEPGAELSLEAAVERWFSSKCPPVCAMHAGDAARGGSVLTAAQLDSSRMFIRADSASDWKSFYMLPVGVDCLPYSYGVGYEGVALQGEDVQTVFESGDRFAVWGAGRAVGPSWMTALESPRVTQGKESRTMSFALKGAGKEEGKVWVAEGRATDVHVSVLQLLHSRAGPTPAWTVVTSVDPLVVVDSVGEASTTDCRSLTLDLDRARGIFAAQLSSDAVAHTDNARKRMSLIRIVLSVLAVVLAIIGIYFGVSYGSITARRERVLWIEEFYKQNAPEKLKDPKFVTKLADKYADNMFVLWRQLEKSYKVKWKPPTSIIEGKDEI